MEEDDFEESRWIGAITRREKPKHKTTRRKPAARTRKTKKEDMDDFVNGDDDTTDDNDFIELDSHFFLTHRDVPKPETKEESPSDK